MYTFEHLFGHPKNCKIYVWKDELYLLKRCIYFATGSKSGTRSFCYLPGEDIDWACDVLIMDPGFAGLAVILFCK